MPTMTESSFYPISLDEIETKVARKNGRRNGWSDNGGYQFSLPLSQCLNNVKEIVNEFGEKDPRRAYIAFREKSSPGMTLWSLLNT